MNVLGRNQVILVWSGVTGGGRTTLDRELRDILFSNMVTETGMLG